VLINSALQAFAECLCLLGGSEFPFHHDLRDTAIAVHEWAHFGDKKHHKDRAVQRFGNALDIL
jgi:hypothetical protein